MDDWDPDADQLVLEEPGEARLGLVQLNSGSTNFNTTLNLTGPILLGLGIAAATLFYAYFNAFKGLVVEIDILNSILRAYRRYRRSPLERGGNPFVSLANCLSETEDDGVGRMAKLLEICSGEGLVACANQLWGVCGMAEVGW